MDVTTILPLVLFLGMERVEETTEDLPGILDDPESYLVCRMICGLTTKSYHRTFVNLMPDLQRSP